MGRPLRAPPAFPVTRSQKVLYPMTGFTKGAMLAYYQRIAEVMLPHLAGHPVAVKRHPDGVEAAGFYEKRCPTAHPDFVTTASCSSSSMGRITYCLVDNVKTLLWLANRAAIEFHGYLYRSGHEDTATMMVFDLDPGAPAGMRDCIAIAFKLRTLLERIGLQSFVKTSGGKGLHLLVPVRGASFAMTKACALHLAESIAAEQPDRVTVRMTKTLRPGRVFIDWSQNDHGKTTVCPYSLRAGATPTVSTPLAWDDLDRVRGQAGHALLSFTPKQVIARVAAVGDLLAPMLTSHQRLPTRRFRTPAESPT